MWSRLAWAGGLALVLTGLVLAWWLGGASPPRPSPRTPPAAAPAAAAPPPVFEEPYRPLAPLSKLQMVDEAIFAGLREAGVDPGHLHVAVRALPDGELTSIVASLPPGSDPQRTRRLLEERLEEAGARLAAEPGEQGQEVLTVRLDGALTHRVYLRGAAPAVPPRPAPVERKPRVALVIDDLGYQLEPAQELLSLGLDLTLSILPHAPQSARIAEMARRAGREVLVHLPMEPNSYPSLDPGPGRLLVSMDAVQLAASTRKSLASVPGAAGANNHMGSLFTANAPGMRAVLGVLKDQGLFFLDSATSPQSLALSEARRLGVPAARRNLFLDHEQSYRAVSRQLERLLKLAGRQDGLIAIGHPHQATIRALKDFAPRLKRSLDLVPVSELVHAAGRLDSGAGNP